MSGRSRLTPSNRYLPLAARYQRPETNTFDSNASLSPALCMSSSSPSYRRALWTREIERLRLVRPSCCLRVCMIGDQQTCELPEWQSPDSVSLLSQRDCVTHFDSCYFRFGRSTLRLIPVLASNKGASNAKRTRSGEIVTIALPV